MYSRFLCFALLLLTTSLHMNAQTEQPGRYASVNGLQLYYEIHGSGQPLVLLHGGGSTIASNYSRILPGLAKKYKVIAIESQSHGHTRDIDRPVSFEQDADDVAALLKQLDIKQADFMGFSNGGTTCLQIAIRHPQLVHKLILCSALYKREGMPQGFFEGMQQATPDQMPSKLKEAYLAANPDPEGLLAMFHRDSKRMINFKDIDAALIKGIQAPALVIGGDRDAVSPAHALDLSRTLPHARLTILPSGHSEYLGEICTEDKDSKLPDVVVTMIDTFLKG